MRYYLGSNGKEYLTEEAVAPPPGKLPSVTGAGVVRYPSYAATRLPQIFIPEFISYQERTRPGGSGAPRTPPSILEIIQAYRDAGLRYPASLYSAMPVAEEYLVPVIRSRQAQAVRPGELVQRAAAPVISARTAKKLAAEAGTGNVIPTSGQAPKGDGIFNVSIGLDEETGGVRTGIQYKPGVGDRLKYAMIFMSQIVKTTDPYEPSRYWRTDGGNFEWSKNGYVWVQKLTGAVHGIKPEHNVFASLDDRPGRGWASDYNQYFETYAIGIKLDGTKDILGGVRWENEVRGGEPTFVTKASHQKVKPGGVSENFIQSMRVAPPPRVASMTED